MYFFKIPEKKCSLKGIEFPEIRFADLSGIRHVKMIRSVGGITPEQGIG